MCTHTVGNTCCISRGIGLTKVSDSKGLAVSVQYRLVTDGQTDTTTYNIYRAIAYHRAVKNASNVGGVWFTNRTMIDEEKRRRCCWFDDELLFSFFFVVKTKTVVRSSSVKTYIEDEVVVVEENEEEKIIDLYAFAQASVQAPNPKCYIATSLLSGIHTLFSCYLYLLSVLYFCYIKQASCIIWCLVLTI